MAKQFGTLNSWDIVEDSGDPGVPLTNLTGNAGDVLASTLASLAKGRPVFVVDTLAGLQSLAAPELKDGHVYRTKGYTTTTDGGYMDFIYFASGLAAAGGADSPLRIAGPGGPDDYFQAFDGGRGIVSTKALGLTQANSIIQGWAYNTIDDVGDAVLLGGSTVNPNGIGDTSVPDGTDFTPGGGAWATDSSYPAGTANFACILGGYDSRNNQLAGSVVGNHHFLKYNAVGHSAIIAGSYCLNEAGRSNIIGSHNAAITHANSIYVVIAGGSGIEVDNCNSTGVLAGNSIDINSSSYAGSVGGFDNEITSSNYSALVGGTLHVIDTSAGVAVLGGEQISVDTSAYSGATGYQNSVTNAGYSFTTGRSNTTQDAYTLVAGRDAETLADNSIVLGKAALSTGGRSQSHIVTTAIRTNSATATNMVSFIELDDTKVTAGVVNVRLVGMRDGSADGENDGTYTYACWETTFTIFWDGTNYAIGSPGNAPTNNTVEPFSTAIYDGFSGGLGGTPELSLSTGALRVRVYGIADTDIEWTATVNLTQLTIA